MRSCFRCTDVVYGRFSDAEVYGQVYGAYNSLRNKSVRSCTALESPVPYAQRFSRNRERRTGEHFATVI